MFRWGPIGLVIVVAALAAATTSVEAQSGKGKKSAANSPPAETAASPDVEEKFKSFCEEWMGKLAAREQDNAGNIQWETRADGVIGAYTAYSKEHTCVLKDGTGSVPVGKITYREYRYEKRGGSIPEAKASQPLPVETTEVTEIFRYSGGKWLY